MGLTLACSAANAQTVDSTFAVNGYLPYGPTGNATQNQGIGNTNAIQPDGKIVVAVDRSNPNQSDLFFYTYRYNADGTPDNTFGVNGVSKIFAGDQSDNKDLFIQPDGKIIVTGETEYCINGICGASQLIVMRLKTNGELDSTFGVNGKILTSDIFGTSGTFAIPERIALTAGGKYVLSGKGMTGKAFVARLNANGTKDLSFATQGVFSDTSICTLTDMATDNDGNIFCVLKKYYYNDTNNRSDNYIFKLNANGVLDNTFGTGGRKIINNISHEHPASIALRSDNKIVVAGYGQLVYPTDPWETGYGETNIGYLLILNPDGSASNVLPQGFKTFKFSGDSTTFIHHVLIGNDDKMLISGRTITKIAGNYHEKAFIAALDNTGNLNTDFAGTGLMKFDYGLHSTIGSLACFFDLKVLPSGRILATGYRNPISFNTKKAVFMLMLKGFAFGPGSTTGLDEIVPGNLESNFYPNPWTSTATLEFELSAPAQLTIELLDLSGKKVHTFVENGFRTAGKQQEQLEIPTYILSGTYFLATKTNNGLVSSRKVIRIQ